MGKNCWELKKCGREKDNSCIAVSQNAGHFCWLVAGTMCDGTVQGTFAQKIGDCHKCDFYILMEREAKKVLAVR